jgi:hypothetical protein
MPGIPGSLRRQSLFVIITPLFRIPILQTSLHFFGVLAAIHRPRPMHSNSPHPSANRPHWAPPSGPPLRSVTVSCSRISRMAPAAFWPRKLNANAISAGSNTSMLILCHPNTLNWCISPFTFKSTRERGSRTESKRALSHNRSFTSSVVL